MAEIRDLDGILIVGDRSVLSVVALLVDIRRGAHGDVDLRRADFAGADLVSADLRGVVLDESSFVDADLTDADLRHCFAPKCDFTRANLTRAKIADAEFWSSNFTDAVLTDVGGLDNADFDEACDFTRTSRQPVVRRVTDWQTWDISRSKRGG